MSTSLGRQAAAHPGACAQPWELPPQRARTDWPRLHEEFPYELLLCLLVEVAYIAGGLAVPALRQRATALPQRERDAAAGRHLPRGRATACRPPGHKARTHAPPRVPVHAANRSSMSTTDERFVHLSSLDHQQSMAIGHRPAVSVASAHTAAWRCLCMACSGGAVPHAVWGGTAVCTERPLRRDA